MKGKLVLVTLAVAVSMTGGMTAVHAASASAPSSKASVKRFCDVNWKVSEVFNTIPDEPTPAQIARIQTRLDSLLADAQDVAPKAIASEVADASAIIGKGLETAFNDPALPELGTTIDGWAADHCDYQVVDVHATEYHFEGIPKKLEPGRTVFRLTNEGKELHEISVARMPKGATLDTLIKKAMSGGIDVEGGTFATQGTTTYGYVTLKNGRYAAVCFVPIGSVDPNVELEGTPHASNGMAQTFTVS